MKSIYFILFFSEFATSLVSPFFTFLFFSASSAFFINADNAERAAMFGIFIGLYKLGGMLCNPIFGTFSDILGRKKTIIITLIGMFIFGLFTIVAILWGNVYLFIFGAVLFSLLFAAKPVCTAAVNDISDSDSDKVKNQALIQFWIGVGVSIGPAIGGYMGDIKVFDYCYMFPFIILLVCSLLLLSFSRFFLKETLHKTDRGSIRDYFYLEPIIMVFKNRLLLSLLFIHLLNQLSWGNYYDFVPAVAKVVFGYDIKSVGVFMGFIGICLVLSSALIIPFFPKTAKGINVIITSSVLGAFGVLVTYLVSFFPTFCLSKTLFWLSVPFVASGDVLLFCYLITKFSESVGKKYQGTIVGFIYITGFGMWSLSAPFGGWLMKWQSNGALLISPVAMIILIIFVLSAKKNSLPAL